MFFLGRGWTPHDELYGIVDQSIDPGLGLHEPIGIPELSTFDPKVCMIPIVYNTDCFFVAMRHKFVHCWQTVHWVFGGEMIFVSPQRCGNVLMFCLGRWWTPRDELYGIVDQSIDSGFGLHELISILELSTLNLEMCMIPIVCSIDYFFVTGRYKFLQVLANCSLNFLG